VNDDPKPATPEAERERLLKLARDAEALVKEHPEAGLQVAAE
jgi:hypothetical protein